ncbi:hypothetical protein ACO2Q0_17100 [Phenylobacterium sp. VNQ135]|uniref:hypothetical protein n=1 Tax=Phenylobacterium sp. VNQ135 TaxID=3400922 RepID=UPI003C0AA0BD
MILSRRELMAAAPVGAGLAAADPAEPWVGVDPRWLQAALERYAGFGDKASGGAGDTACGAWLEAELSGLGYVCRRQGFEVPTFEPRASTLSMVGARASVIPQAHAAPTGPQGVTGPLRLAASGGDLNGAIALIVLPYKRWVSLVDPLAARPMAEAFARGAAAAVLVTTGPTGEAVALNVSTRRPAYARPAAILAPKDAAPFLAAAAEGRAATLILDGIGDTRQAFNLVGRRDRKAAKTVVISTPRSGWFGCAAERGSGLVVWLALAHWLARADLGVNVELAANSGHEYEYLGGEHYLETLAPKPADTRLWLHIGACAATRDWHEFGPVLRPLPSADAQRVLTATPDLIGAVRPAFAGITGLEATLEANAATAGGELTNVLKAGYRSAIGLYGAHRFFHTRGDDMRCTSGDLVAPVAGAFRAALSACLA